MTSTLTQLLYSFVPLIPLYHCRVVALFAYWSSSPPLALPPPPRPPILLLFATTASATLKDCRVCGQIFCGNCAPHRKVPGKGGIVINRARCCEPCVEERKKDSSYSPLLSPTRRYSASLSSLDTTASSSSPSSPGTYQNNPLHLRRNSDTSSSQEGSPSPAAVTPPPPKALILGIPRLNSGGDGSGTVEEANQGAEGSKADAASPRPESDAPEPGVTMHAVVETEEGTEMTI